jgi:alpha-1,2-mannosyltransferase
MEEPMRTHRPLAYLPAAGLASIASVYWAIIAATSLTNIQPRGNFSDFAHFYAAARALRRGLGPDIYSAAVIERIDRLPGGCAGTSLQIPYINPPLLAELLQPFTALSCTDAFRVWRLISLAIWASVTALLAWQVWRRCLQRGMSPPWSATAAAFIVALSAFAYPVLDGLWLGQMHLLILGGIVLAWWLRERNHPYPAGGILAAITLIKLLPAVLIFYFVLRRDWRIVAGAAIGTVLLVGVMLIGGGGLPTLLAMIPSLTSDAGLLPWANKAVITLHPVVGPALAAGAGLSFVSTVILVQRMGSTEEDATLGYAWAICTMLVIWPLVWLHYLTWLLPVVAACLPYIRSRVAALGLALASAAILLSTPRLMGAMIAAMLFCWGLTGVLYIRAGIARPAGAVAKADGIRLIDTPPLKSGRFSRPAGKGVGGGADTRLTGSAVRERSARPKPLC